MSSISSASGRVLSTDLKMEAFFSEKRNQIEDFYKDIPSIFYQSQCVKEDFFNLATKNLESRITFNHETDEYKELILLKVLEFQMKK